MPEKRSRGKLRLGLPKRSLLEPEPLEDLAMGVGLTGIYAFLALAIPLAAPGLAPVIALYASGVALVFSWWLHKYYRRTRQRWAAVAALVLLAVVAGKPLAAYLGVAGFYQSLLDGLLFLTASLTLHRVSRLEGLPPHVAIQLDRQGGLGFLGTFATLIPLPLVVAVALLLVSFSLLRGYTLLQAIARAQPTMRRERGTPSGAPVVRGATAGARAR